jgi:hypothetical protein
MMAARLSHRDVRALVVGGIGLFLLLAVPRAARAWLAWRAEATQAAAEMTLELERTRRTIAGLGAALDSAEARVSRFRELGTMLFVVRKQAEAAAALTGAIGEAAAGSTIRIIGVETRLDTTSVPKTLRRISATVHANGDITGLASLLERLESRRTLLALRKLSVHPQNVEAPQNAAEVLDIRLTVEALALISGEQKKP